MSVTREALRWLSYPALTFLTYDFLHTTTFHLQWVNGPSMAPTLSPEAAETGNRDLVLVILRRNPFSWLSSPSSTAPSPSYSPYPDLRRGDLVTLTAPHNPNGESVKRIIGLPGDMILRDPRRLGKQADEEGRMSTFIGMEPLPPAVKVPTGAVWVEGDAWRVSRDSNDFGPVSAGLINGKVWGIVRPFSRFGKLPENGKQPDSGTVVVEAMVEPPTFLM